MSTFNVAVVLLMCLRFYNSAMNSSLIVIGRLNSQIFSFRLRRILNFRFSSVLCVVPAAHDPQCMLGLATHIGTLFVEELVRNGACHVCIYFFMPTSNLPFTTILLLCTLHQAKSNKYRCSSKTLPSFYYWLAMALLPFAMVRNTIKTKTAF